MQWLITNLSQFQILQKNNSKIKILKLPKDQKILKNQMIHCLQIIETIYIYIYIYVCVCVCVCVCVIKTIEKYELHLKE